ncbi:hypothetical protein SOVF_047830 [Spinacia oleracea]|uniref:Agamous-like MADS-box protein AGL61 n=1 Tax=Spinacia oleracea TaxID=3562 RepID=A0ABM3RE13_SPIOL|nr:agamous-like MADS-box protein AGL61 [Spinacia oleracea]KNA20917.1 hypothetical protein SOVF_047830 [Spinacia oleracea]
MANNNNETGDNSKEVVIRKRSNGRRKIPIERITDPNRKHVTFSKRRIGLFKKGSELCALCGVEMAILTFSERGKLFCFGHPNSDSVIHRYLTCGSRCLNERDECELNLMLQEKNRQHKEIKRKIDEKKKFNDHYKKKEDCGFWWEEANVNEMGLNELEQFKGCLMELRNNVAKKADELTRTSLVYSSSQIGNSIVFDQLDTNHNKISSLGCNPFESSIQNFENPIMMSNSNHLIAMEDRDANADVVSQSFKFRSMNEINMEESGQDITHFSNLSQKRMGGLQLFCDESI